MNSSKIIFFLAISLLVPFLLRAEELTAINDASQKLVLLESKVRQLNTSQAEIIQKLEQINQELANLRIWIKRNRS